MSRRISAIKFAHQMRNLTDPTRNARVVEYDVPDRAGNGAGELVVLLTTCTPRASDASTSTRATARPSKPSSREISEAGSATIVGTCVTSDKPVTSGGGWWPLGGQPHPS